MSQEYEEWEKIKGMERLSPKLLNDVMFEKMILSELSSCLKSPLLKELKYEVDLQGAFVLKKIIWAPNAKEIFNVSKENFPSGSIPDKFNGEIWGQAVSEEIHYEVHELPRQSTGNNSDDAYFCVTTRSATNNFLPDIKSAHRVETVSKSTWHQGIEVAGFSMISSLITAADQLRVPIIESRGWISDKYFPTYIDTLGVGSFPSGVGINFISVSARQQGDTDGIIVKRVSEINNPNDPQCVEKTIYQQASTRTPNELAGGRIIGIMCRNLKTGSNYIEVGNRRFEPVTNDANIALEDAIQVARLEYNELMTKYYQKSTSSGIHI